MAKVKKPQRVTPRLPRGFVDREADDLRTQDKMLATIRRVYESYGFEPVETPVFEFTDALGKFLPDSDRPNEGVFSLQDDDEQWMSLRYDLTAPLARFVAENYETLPKPYRSYRAGYVFRNEKPGPGRFRQFMQFDADIVGAPNVSADAEMAMMMADTMEALGIPRGQYVIRVNNRKVLDGVLEAIGLGGEENAGRRLTVLRAIDKLDKFGVEGVRLLLGEGRKDESGDFTPGAGLDDAAIQRLLVSYVGTSFRIDDEEIREQSAKTGEPALLGNIAGEETYRDNRAIIGFWRNAVGESLVGTEGVNECSAIEELCRGAGYGPGRIEFSASVVRGLEYYTGPVFEAELLFDVVNEKGQKVQFGSVGGGGRYDGLVSRFMSQPVPATGFSIGVSRLMTALKNLGRLETSTRTGPVVVTVMDRDRMADYQAMATKLREALNPKDGNGEFLGPVVPVEVFQGNPKQFGKQLQYADRRNSPCVVIQGGDEKAAGKVQVKDLALGKEMSAEITDNAEWREARAGQELVDESEMIEAVTAILARQAGASRP
ncbi:histidine--tRNA ligase [Fulvimarina sp. 2208YS6-2-32]|uniref:Histidine--tRNA ligase n=1 Tax=Fulvimarina uroteuthidis TaxID=3098149 RepID=A0ABU5HYI6_9HYPH|nr:histidine--tRNA ligase [Fulvimarina sp. 2208YS6-2-32]MDY8107952.1 histidine--tRNA ligase [Fulvimarina sp. 2208YS6-2-32]